jgi:hypothetical protein
MCYLQQTPTGETGAFLAFAREYVEKVNQQGRIKSAADYNSLLNSLEDYLQRDFVYTKEFTGNSCQSFQTTSNQSA